MILLRLPTIFAGLWVLLIRMANIKRFMYRLFLASKPSFGLVKLNSNGACQGNPVLVVVEALFMIIRVISFMLMLPFLEIALILWLRFKLYFMGFNGCMLMVLQVP